MAIVFPNQFNGNIPSMASTGIQADVSDPEGVLGTIKSFQEQVEELQNMAGTLRNLRTERAGALDQSAGAIEELGNKLENLMGSIAQMDNNMVSTREEMSETDRELEDLSNEKERLENEAGMLHGQEVEIHNVDLDNEQRLLGFVQEELFRKTEELSHLKQRHEMANEEFNKEWNEYKREMLQYEEEKEPYLEKLDHVNELTLAKYVGTKSGKDTESSDRDFTDRMVAHHFNKIQHRQLQHQLIASQIKQKDLEAEIGDLITKKKDLWKRCLDLEHCLEKLQGSNEETNMLRPASAYSNLPDIMEGRFPKYSHSSEEMGHVEPESYHGFMLHRCHKNIDISIGQSISEDNIVSMMMKTDVGGVDDVTKQVNEDQGPSSVLPDPQNDPDEGDRDEGPEEPEDQPPNNFEQNQTMTRALISDADQMDRNVTMFSKLRQRMSGLSSSLRGNRGNNPLLASGSVKRSDKTSGAPGRRRR